jgi:hypothetical protein
MTDRSVIGVSGGVEKQDGAPLSLAMAASFLVAAFCVVYLPSIGHGS